MAHKFYLTARQAETLIDAFDIRTTMEDSVEAGMLEAHNPDLLDAYEALLAIADHNDDSEIVEVH